MFRPPSLCVLHSFCYLLLLTVHYTLTGGFHFMWTGHFMKQVIWNGHGKHWNIHTPLLDQIRRLFCVRPMLESNAPLQSSPFAFFFLFYGIRFYPVSWLSCKNLSNSHCTKSNQPAECGALQEFNLGRGPCYAALFCLLPAFGRAVFLCRALSGNVRMIHIVA